MGCRSLRDTTLKSVLVLGLLALADARENVPAKCPRGNPGNETVQIPHETDCTKFYLCLGSRKIERDCPVMDSEGNRLHFNPELGVCDWPQNAGCTTDLPIIWIEPLAAERPIPTKCPLVDSKNQTVHIAHEKDCTKFYKCSYGKRYLMQCPLDRQGNRLHFNPREQVCDWPYNVNCTLPLPAIVLRTLVVEDDYPTECPLVDSFNETIQLPHETDCTKYYMCNGGKKVAMVCPLMDKEGNRLYFNPETHGCDWPWNVDCQTAYFRVEMAMVLRKAVPKECPLHDSMDHTVHLPHESDCTKFYKCSYGKKWEMDCPKTVDGTKLHWNKTEQVCDWPWNVDCDWIDPEIGTSTLTTGVTDPITTLPSTIPPSTTEPSTTEPSTTEPSTAEPSTTEPSTTEPSTNEPSTTPSNSPGIEGCRGACPNHDPPNKITALPHVDCRKWCRCENRQVKVFTCPADFHFSPSLGKCTKPEDAGCKQQKKDYRSQVASQHDEALMNVLRYNKRFLW